MHPPNPEMRSPAAANGRANRKSDDSYSSSDSTETAPTIQARRLVSRFGLAYETAVVIADLAWGGAR